MTDRNDIHCPKNFNPGDYTERGEIYQGSCEEADAIFNTWNAAWGKSPWEWVEEKPFDGNHQAKSTCDHCGARFAYGVVFTHNVTGEAIVVGHICAGKFCYNSRRELEHARKLRRLEKAREARKNANAFKAIVDAHPGLAEALEEEDHIVQDIKARGAQYGSLSEKQIALVFKIKAQRDAWAAKKAEQDKNSLPVEEGRRVIEGTIVSTKWQEGGFGYYPEPTAKMLVDTGINRLWGTCPAKINLGDLEDLKGCKVRFLATVEKSADDEFFGYFKRPAKAELLTEPESWKETAK